jgi:hypothetical protein
VTLLGEVQEFFLPRGWDKEKRKLVVASRSALVTISAACLFLAIYIDVYKPREEDGTDSPAKSRANDSLEESTVLRVSGARLHLVQREIVCFA